MSGSSGNGDPGGDATGRRWTDRGRDATRAAGARLDRVSDGLGARVGRVLRIVGWVLLAAIVAVWLAFLDYTLPTSRLVHITGVDVVRMDQRVGRSAELSGTGRTRDVRMINAVDLDGDPLVFRNEDTGWGWPPFFKFNSGTLASEAQAIVQRDHDATVRIRYYGWRLEMVSMFPNVLDVDIVPEDAGGFPWLKVVLMVLINGAIVALIWYVVRLIRRI